MCKVLSVSIKCHVSEYWTWRWDRCPFCCAIEFWPPHSLLISMVSLSNGGCFVSGNLMTYFLLKWQPPNDLISPGYHCSLLSDTCRQLIATCLFVNYISQCPSGWKGTWFFCGTVSSDVHETQQHSPDITSFRFPKFFHTIKSTNQWRHIRSRIERVSCTRSFIPDCIA